MNTTNKDYINSINLNANTDFPYLVLDATSEGIYPLNPGFRVMHWHVDLQFIYVFTGEIKVKTLDTELIIKADEGIFLNKNIVHLIAPLGVCHYKSFIFPDYFLKFYSGSPAGQFVDHLIMNEQFQFCHFEKGLGWCSEILSKLRQLALLERHQSELYIYEVLVLLSSIWLILQKNMPLQPIKKEVPANLRMQKFLEYIEQNYSTDITLEDLANSANVSKSECLRCFKTSMQTTPYKYLIELRLSKAAVLLKNSNAPIGHIAERVGFHQISHFGKCFKEKTGYSPSEYRKIHPIIRHVPHD